ncbi:hypothetical protein Tco_1539956 [Tanacetum coccineum]
MTIPTLLMLLESHSLSNRTPVKIPRKALHKITTIVGLECGESFRWNLLYNNCTCKSCGKGAHIGYNCPPKAPIISNSGAIAVKPFMSSHRTCASLDTTCYSEKKSLYLTFYSSDESFSEEDVPNENFKIFSNPLFDLDEEITSTKVDQIDDEVLENTNSIPPGIEYLCFNAKSDLLESLLHRDTSINDSQKIDSLLDEFAGELTLPHSIPPGIDDVNLDPEGDIFSFSPSPIPVEDSDSLMEEIDIFLDGDDSIPPGIENDDFDSEDDDNSTSVNRVSISFHFDYLRDSGNSTIDCGGKTFPVGPVHNILPPIRRSYGFRLHSFK